MTGAELGQLVAVAVGAAVTSAIATIAAVARGAQPQAREAPLLATGPSTCSGCAELRRDLEEAREEHRRDVVELWTALERERVGREELGRTLTRIETKQDEREARKGAGRGRST